MCIALREGTLKHYTCNSEPPSCQLFPVEDHPKNARRKKEINQLHPIFSSQTEFTSRLHTKERHRVAGSDSTPAKRGSSLRNAAARIWTNIFNAIQAISQNNDMWYVSGPTLQSDINCTTR